MRDEQKPKLTNKKKIHVKAHDLMSTKNFYNPKYEFFFFWLKKIIITTRPRPIPFLSTPPLSPAKNNGRKLNDSGRVDGRKRR